MIKPLKYLFTLAIPIAIAGVYAMRTLSPQGGGALSHMTRLPPAKGQIRKLVSTSGPVRALVTVSVGSQISGQVDKLAVDFNSEVKAGDILATIDARSYDAKVAQAKADLAAARAGLLNQEAALTKAKAILDNAERIADRQETAGERFRRNRDPRYRAPRSGGRRVRHRSRQGTDRNCQVGDHSARSRA